LTASRRVLLVRVERSDGSFSTWVTEAILLFLMLLGGLSSLFAGRQSQVGPAGRTTPKILLTATPAFGFAPLSVQLVATLSGVNPHDANFCHAGVTWIRVDPVSAPETGARLTEDPKCVHGEEEISVATTYSKTFELAPAGSYLYRIVVSGKDGTQIKSNFVKVRVLRVP